jgi:endo-1,4-beta-D-glucanase Y
MIMAFRPPSLASAAPLAALLVALAPGCAHGPAHPFGSRPQRYAPGVIRPSGDPAALDRAVRAFYDAWKARYLVPGCGGTILLTGGGTGASDAITISEGHGYAMIITALMAGHDPQARALFDRLDTVFHRFPSSIDHGLMAWAIEPGCRPVHDGDAATDGDLDIAYALLLASRQWGGRYLAEARRLLDSIERSEMDPGTHLPLLGDWQPGEAEFAGATRPSDFMPGHFRAFARATGRTSWSAAVDAVYRTVEVMQARYAPQTGLLPDFVVHADAHPAPAPAPFIDEKRPSDYDYNSCRVPFRLGADHVLTGDPRAGAALARLDAFAMRTSGGDPAHLASGFHLDGSPYRASVNECFRAAFAVAATGNAAGQRWLDALWWALVKRPLTTYYEDTLKLLGLIVISGNWWAP